MIAAETFRLHYRCVAAVAGSAGQREEHVEIVIRVVAPLEAIPTDGHARRDATRPTPIGDNVRNPDQTALGMVVVTAHYGGKFARSSATSDQPLAPFDAIGVGNRSYRRQEFIQQQFQSF